MQKVNHLTLQLPMGFLVEFKVNEILHVLLLILYVLLVLT
jgi:hypothetical protein